MNLENRLAISYYKEIAEINKEHQVYLVQHLETKKLFVKKILSVYNLDIYTYLMEHPIIGVPHIYAMCEENQKLTIIEEYLTGDTLAERLEKQGPMDIRTACGIVYPLCNIVSDLHSCTPPIIHRDIKPSNVLITPDNHVYLLDYNGAKYYSEDENKDTVLLGTHGFAAPEQYGFGASCIQTDIYAIGVLLKTLVAGGPQEEAFAGTFYTIVETCTKLNPYERYASVAELQMMLARILDRNASPNTEPSKPSKETKPAPWYLLPGFRTLNPLYILLACGWYTLFADIALTLEVENASPLDQTVERIICFLMFFGSTLFAGNYMDMQEYFPLCKHEKLWIRIPAVFITTVAFMFLCLVLAAISSSIL